MQLKSAYVATICRWASITPNDFAARLVTGSQEQSYDYAVLGLPELVHPNDHQLALAGC
jgi:hypothetical protein